MFITKAKLISGTLWSWSYCNWIYNYLCSQCMSPLKSWSGVLDNTFYDKVCQWLEAGRWFSTGTPLSSTRKTPGYMKSKPLVLKVNTIRYSENVKDYQLFLKVLIWLWNVEHQCERCSFSLLCLNIKLAHFYPYIFFLLMGAI